MKTKYTRQDYLNNKCSHEEYYGQFVTEGVRSLVQTNIGIDAIKSSKDTSFNDIPLYLWDSLHREIMNTHGCKTLLLLAGDVCANTLCNSVCIAKCAAKQLK